MKYLFLFVFKGIERLAGQKIKVYFDIFIKIFLINRLTI